MTDIEVATPGRGKRCGAGLAFGALVVLSGQVDAASAVAFDVDDSQYGYVYNVSDETQAMAQAMRSCAERSGSPCRIVLVCRSGGYGAISYFPRQGVERAAWGAVCGQASERQAQELAKTACNRHAKGRCGNPDTAWFDDAGR